ncbi:MAG: hypothetical protein NXY57DRAFT_979753 [Lentinula lateritia]|nr:MAG: hypothetical protein NXY57DRAFT_979753 [Lentinula lateritia]
MPVVVKEDNCQDKAQEIRKVSFHSFSLHPVHPPNPPSTAMHPNTGKTPRSKARAPDHSVKEQLLGRSPPPPRFIYGKRGRISSNPGSPSCGTNRLTSAPPFSLVLDYEEPRLIPDTEVLPNDL